MIHSQMYCAYFDPVPIWVKYMIKSKNGTFVPETCCTCGHCQNLCLGHTSVINIASFMY